MRKLLVLFVLVLFGCGLVMAGNANFTGKAIKPEKKADKVATMNIPNVPNSGLILQGGDTVEEAAVIDALDFTDNGTTEGYTHDYDEVCNYEGSLSPDVVYSFTPDADVKVDINLLGSDYDTKVYVYENTVTPGSPYACNDDYWDDYTSYIGGLDLYTGNTYYIVVDGYNSNYGNYVLSVSASPPPPPGDVCEDALVISELPFNTSGNTCEFYDDCDITGSNSKDVIFVMTVDTERFMEVSLQGSDYDTKLAIFYEDCCTGAGTEWAYNDDYYDLESAILINFIPGTYYIVVDGFSGACGAYYLSIFDTDRPVICNQDYIGPEGDWNFLTSDVELGPYVVYDDFYCEDLTNVTDITWWGLDLQRQGDEWYECEEDPTTVAIKFYTPYGDHPDIYNPVCEYTVQPEITYTGVYYESTYELVQFHVTLDEPCALTDGWFSIQGIQNEGDVCIFLWSAATTGNSLSYQAESGVMEQLTDDLSHYITGTTDIPEANLLPTQYDMLANYPNPFNAKTTIAFSLKNSGNVAIEIYDVLGRSIDKLDLGYLDNSQVHTVNYDAAKLATGVYFYNLMVNGEKKVTERFSLLK